jgi:hypothetical protein
MTTKIQKENETNYSFRLQFLMACLSTAAIAATTIAIMATKSSTAIAVAAAAFSIMAAKSSAGVAATGFVAVSAAAGPAGIITALLILAGIVSACLLFSSGSTRAYNYGYTPSIVYTGGLPFFSGNSFWGNRTTTVPGYNRVYGNSNYHGHISSGVSSSTTHGHSSSGMSGNNHGHSTSGMSSNNHSHSSGGFGNTVHGHR